MFRALPVCACLLLFAPINAAPPAATERTIRLTVQPAAAPVPSLRYQLLPELSEMNPGNPIQGYLRCFGERHSFFFGTEAVAKREKWQKTPLKELPAHELLDYGGLALRQADIAARLDTPDWQTLLPLRAAGPALPIPELQQMRALAHALSVRFRARIAAGHFDDALVTAKTMLALARHCGEHPTLIGGLIGVANASLALEPLEEMIGQPGCPNLYWALTQLPDPFIDFRKPMLGERMVFGTELTAMSDPRAPLSAETRALARGMVGAPQTLIDEDVRLDTEEAQLQRVTARIWLLLALADEGKGHMDQGQIRAWLREREADKDYLTAARKRLDSAGIPVAKLKTWQVVLTNEKLGIEIDNDKAIRTMALPFWQAEPTINEAAKKSTSLFVPLTAPVNQIRLSQVRLAQRFALLRTIEAIRLYAAAHDGKAPTRLADVGVPTPVDPVTGKPFVYEAKQSSFTLRGTPPRGKEKQAPFNLRFEVTIRK